MTDPTYTHLLAKANERAQRRFRNALAHPERWDIETTNLYLQAENLVERLELGPCDAGCPAREGGDHQHDPYPADMTYAAWTESEKREAFGR